MPKGEHFKKPNPRINQVSFKVNDKELAQLQKLADDRGMSVPQWLRQQITDGGQPSAATAKTKAPSKPEKPKKAQMSLF